MSVKEEKGSSSMDENSSEEKIDHKKSDKGVVTARKCEHCGHHEIGITNEAGEYIPLKPGMVVNITSNDQ